MGDKNFPDRSFSSAFGHLENTTVTKIRTLSERTIDAGIHTCIYK